MGRGLYSRTDAELSEHRTLAEAAKRVPHAVVCLLSALQVHELTTQTPHEVWLGIANKARKPTVDWPPIHVVRFSSAALVQGVERKIVDAVPVMITTAILAAEHHNVMSSQPLRRERAQSLQESP